MIPVAFALGTIKLLISNGVIVASGLRHLVRAGALISSTDALQVFQMVACWFEIAVPRKLDTKDTHRKTL